MAMVAALATSNNITSPVNNLFLAVVLMVLYQ
jgi:hypothetical protein